MISKRSATISNVIFMLKSHISVRIQSKGVAKGAPRGPPPSIECCFTLLRTNDEQVSDF